MEVFIMQNKRDKTKEELLSEMEHTIDIVKRSYPDKNIKIVDSEIIKGAMIKASPLWAMGQLLQLLSAVDLVVFAENAVLGRECRIVQVCCEEFNIPFAHCVGHEIIK
jgi:hypothetical protein